MNLYETEKSSQMKKKVLEIVYNREAKKRKNPDSKIRIE